MWTRALIKVDSEVTILSICHEQIKVYYFLLFDFTCISIRSLLQNTVFKNFAMYLV